MTVYVDNALSPVGTFNVTAGTGADASGGSDPTDLRAVNGLFMGSNNTPTTTSLDVDYYSIAQGVFEPTLVPEPSSIALAGIGLLMLALGRWHGAVRSA